MSRITINSNQFSLNAQRRLSESSKVLSQSFNRLSSGLRIHRAGDDAAGLAVSSLLQTDRRVSQQGVRNISDGISLLSIADGAISELTNLVIRITELAEQAANGALGHRQRDALDEEAQQLKAEYTRIVKTTEFNGRKILAGDYGKLRVQAGYGEAGAVISGMGGAVGTGSFEARVSFTTGNTPFSIASGDFNSDGFIDLITADQSSNTVSVALGDGTGSFLARVSFAAGTDPRTIALSDFNGDGFLDVVTSNSGSSSLNILLGNGNGSFQTNSSFAAAAIVSANTGDFNGDGLMDIVTGDNMSHTVSIYMGNGNGTFLNRISYSAGMQPQSVISGDFNGDGKLDLAMVNPGEGSTGSIMLGNGNGSFSSRVSFSLTGTSAFLVAGDFNNDGILDLAASELTSNSVSVLIGNGNGSFQAKNSFSVGSFPEALSIGDFNGDGNLDIVTPDYFSDVASVLLGNGNGSFLARTSFQTGSQPIWVTSADFNADGVLDIATADRASNALSILKGSSTTGTAPILDFSLQTMASARQALPLLRQKLNHLTAQRGAIGAFESRLSTAKNVLQTNVENYAAAASQITDVDVAEESSRLLSTQILQQSATAVLGQANQQPTLAIQLLKDIS